MTESETDVIKARYELSFLVRSADDAAKVTGAATRHNAEIALQGPINQINLAYPIKKETSAYFGFIQFVLERAEVLKLSEELGHEAAVLRFLLVESPIEQPRAEAAEKAPAPAETPTGGAKSATPRTGITTNEVLEKRLEEILK